MISLFFFLIGVFLGYGVFFFRYQDAKTIDGMRTRISTTSQSLDDLEHQYEEIFAQNKLLKERGRDLLDQNTDYTKMISELHRVIHLIKKAATQAKELNSTLAGFDTSIEEKYLKMGDKIAADTPTTINIPIYDKKIF